MFDDFTTQIQSDELASLYFFEDVWYDDEFEDD